MRDGVVGNTEPPLKVYKREKEQGIQYIKWCFTLNNYTKEEIETIETTFRQTCRKYIFQEETGEEGTPHLQGVIHLKAKKRITELKFIPRIHWEKCNNWDASIIYCSKELTRTGAQYSMGMPKPIKRISTLTCWQKEIEDLLLSEPDGRTVHWYHEDEGGIGKSAFTKYMFLTHKTLMIDVGKYSDIMLAIHEANMDEVTMIIFDIPRSFGNKISYPAIEAISNGLIRSTKYEGGMKAFNPPHIVVFNNEEPDYSKLSEDRWKVVDLKYVKEKEDENMLLYGNPNPDKEKI